MVSTLLLWGCALLTQNNVATPPPIAGEVQRLVRELDDVAQTKRDAAEKALVAVGDEVLPLLPTITPRTPAETTGRLGVVRCCLENRRAG